MERSKLLNLVFMNCFEVNSPRVYEIKSSNMCSFSVYYVQRIKLTAIKLYRES